MGFFNSKVSALKRNSFLKNVVVLMSGTVVAQIIPFLALPFISRIYTPDLTRVFTVYTSIMCGESLRFYWTTYQNQQIQCVDMNHLKKGMKAVQFDLEQPPNLHLLSCPEK